MADTGSRSGGRYATAAILDYANRTHVAHDSALTAAFAAPERDGLPAIQLSPSEAKTVATLARLVGARTAVEIGTLAGYSGIHIARALVPGGRLWSIESTPEHAAVARRNFERAGVADRVEVVEGQALEVLGQLEPHGPFDLVFVDADKSNYDRFGRWAATNLRPGGLLLVDNSYLFGRLLNDDPSAAAVRRLHEESRLHFDTVCLPTPDGLLVGVRK